MGGIMEKKMETGGIMGYVFGYILGSYWDSGQENGNYYSVLGQCWDNGNYYSMLGLHWDVVKK